MNFGSESVETKTEIKEDCTLDLNSQGRQKYEKMLILLFVYIDTFFNTITGVLTKKDITCTSKNHTNTLNLKKYFDILVNLFIKSFASSLTRQSILL